MGEVGKAWRGRRHGLKKYKRPSGRKIGGRFSEGQAAWEEEAALPDSLEALEEGAPNESELEGGRLAGDGRNVGAIDAEILEFTRREPDQLIVGVSVLPPVAVPADQTVGHDRGLSHSLVEKLVAMSLPRRSVLKLGPDSRPVQTEISHGSAALGAKQHNSVTHVAMQ